MQCQLDPVDSDGINPCSVIGDEALLQLRKWPDPNATQSQQPRPVPTFQRKQHINSPTSVSVRLRCQGDDDVTGPNALFAAQAKIEESGGKLARSVPVASWDDITGAMPNFSQEEGLFPFSIDRLFPKFLQLFDGVPQTLEKLIKFNEDHADLEFTERDNNQKTLEAGRDTTITEEQYDRNFKTLRGAASHTLVSLMKQKDVDVLLGPCADFNGRPFSLHAIAPAGEEVKIFQVMSAWEASFPNNVRPPPLLVEHTFPVQ